MENIDLLALSSIYSSHRLIKKLTKNKLGDDHQYDADKLLAWHRRQLFFHHARMWAATILSIVLTGPIFHLAYCLTQLISDEKIHFHWLRSFQSFREERYILKQIKQAIDLALNKDQAPQVLLPEQKDYNNPRARKKEKKLLFLHPLVKKDVRTLILQALPDDLLINSFIKPVHKAARTAALEELFKRNTETAQNYFFKFLFYHAVRQTLEEQPVTIYMLQNFLKNYKKMDEDIFFFIHSALDVFGYQPDQNTLWLRDSRPMKEHRGLAAFTVTGDKSLTDPPWTFSSEDTHTPESWLPDIYTPVSSLCFFLDMLSDREYELITPLSPTAAEYYEHFDDEYDIKCDARRTELIIKHSDKKRRTRLFTQFNNVIIERSWHNGIDNTPFLQKTISGLFCLLEYGIEPLCADIIVEKLMAVVAVDPGLILFDPEKIIQTIPLRHFNEQQKNLFFRHIVYYIKYCKKRRIAIKNLTVIEASALTEEQQEKLVDCFQGYITWLDTKFRISNRKAYKFLQNLSPNVRKNAITKLIELEQENKNLRSSGNATTILFRHFEETTQPFEEQLFEWGASQMFVHSKPHITNFLKRLYCALGDHKEIKRFINFVKAKHAENLNKITQQIYNLLLSRDFPHRYVGLEFMCTQIESLFTPDQWSEIYRHFATSSDDGETKARFTKERYEKKLITAAEKETLESELTESDLTDASQIYVAAAIYPYCKPVTQGKLLAKYRDNFGEHLTSFWAKLNSEQQDKIADSESGISPPAHRFE